MTEFRNDTQKLIDYSVSFAKTILSESKEFYPFAAAINHAGELVPIEFFEGDDFPDSHELATKLEILLDQQIADGIKRSYCVTLHVLVRQIESENSKDAISIRIKHKEVENKTVYYLTYSLTDKNEIEIIDSWAES